MRVCVYCASSDGEFSADETDFLEWLAAAFGLDRAAAKELFNDFLDDGMATSAQIEFVNLIVDHLTEHGAMKPDLLYESPFIDINPQGPDGVFDSSQVDQLIGVLSVIHARAAA